MRYLTFTDPERSSYEICFLMSQLNQNDMERFYITPYLENQKHDVLVYTLFKDTKRTLIKMQREYLDELLPILSDLQVRYLVTCDAEYFKTLTKAPNADSSIGYVLPCTHPDFENMFVIYCPNYRAVFYNPDKVKDQIRISLQALIAHQQGVYISPGMDIIKFAAYPNTVQDIRDWLHKLLDEHQDLTADIEGFSLKHYDAGIGTISFAWNKHEGIAFPVDLLESLEDARMVRFMLLDFFREFASRSQKDGRRMRWHSINYDVTVLISQLFMDHLLDTEGLLEGLDVMLASWDCTKLITYLATNSCAGNTLGLKPQSQEYAGNYGIDEIKDIRKVPLDKLLQYNLVDSLCTWFVYEKHWDTLVADNQLEIYDTIFKPGMWDIIQMQLTGLPIDMKETSKVAIEIQEQSDQALDRMVSNLLVQNFLYDWRDTWIDKENQKLKTKTRSMAEAENKVFFNPSSPLQLQTFLYDEKYLDLPVLDYTDTKLPSTGADTLEKLIHHTQDPQAIDFLEALIAFKSVEKILTSFLPHFLSAPQAPDGWHYLFGNFNLGGTLSGRLSSSGPNLQNLPANGKNAIKKVLAKLMKRCVKAPPGYLFIGLDFSSLEDRISALTTKDPNKLKVYTDGFDGHCLRAYAYFNEVMPDIDPSSVESINSIEVKYPTERQKSKTPTFALTYQGTFHTLMDSGFDIQTAKKIEAAYHDLYQVSDQWVAERLEEASQVGYVIAAFGLRVRTPLLHQVIMGTSKTPHEAAAEGRTAGNALGQSWCLLNTRAGIEFNTKVRLSKYRLDIRPSVHIHDAQYFLIPDNTKVLQFVNKHLVKAVQWQEHPDIAHDKVKLGGKLSVYFPNWSTELVIPNDASITQIEQIAQEHYLKYCT